MDEISDRSLNLTVILRKSMMKDSNSDIFLNKCFEVQKILNESDISEKKGDKNSEFIDLEKEFLFDHNEDHKSFIKNPGFERKNPNEICMIRDPLEEEKNHIEEIKDNSFHSNKLSEGFNDVDSYNMEDAEKYLDMLDSIIKNISLESIEMD